MSKITYGDLTPVWRMVLYS